jgi:hypothetical protein
LWWKLWWVLRIPWLKLQVFAEEYWQSAEVRKIAREFCAEVAVLVAVFPALAGLIANAGIRADPKSGNTTQPISLLIVFIVSASSKLLPKLRVGPICYALDPALL